jgi:hypothetical protein
VERDDAGFAGVGFGGRDDGEHDFRLATTRVRALVHFDMAGQPSVLAGSFERDPTAALVAGVQHLEHHWLDF